MKMSYLLIATALMISCNREQPPEAPADHDHASHQEADKYTCPMHPQIVQDSPGTCPICGMDLVKMNTSHTTPQEVMLSDSQIRLGNITTAKVSRKPVGETVVVNGTLTVNQEKTRVVSSRAAGRVEKLYIKDTGQPVRKGEPLYVLYSEALLTLQSEYLLAKEQYEQLGSSSDRYASFMKAAEEKLLLYGLTKAQIGKLDDRTALQPRVTFLSPASGVVTEISVLEGQYVEEGAPIYKTEDVETLWVEAELYPNETALVHTGDQILVNVAGPTAEPLEATVAFLSPEYRESSQVTVMRAEIKNPNLRFRPGQQAQITFTHSSHEAIAVPPDAIIRDEKGSRVYVRSGMNTFSPRIVETGVGGIHAVEITSGLTEGDTVVLTGAYLLHSELMLKGAAHDH